MEKKRKKMGDLTYKERGREELGESQKQGTTTLSLTNKKVSHATQKLEEEQDGRAQGL